MSTMCLRSKHLTHGLDQDHERHSMMERTPFWVAVRTPVQVVLDVLAILMTISGDL